MSKPVNLTSVLNYMQSRFKSKKSRYNSFGKYYFRSAEDILEAIKPFLDEHSVTVRIEEEFIDGAVPVIKSKAIISDGTDAIHATAVVGVDLNQKGMQVPQQFGSASSYGKKYALALEKAKDYIKGGGSIDAIKSKYDVSSAVEKQLQTL